MKKVFAALFVLVLFLGVVNVKAMTESELKTKMTNGYVVDGKAVKPSDYQVSEIERYLNKYEVSETDCTFIAEKMDEIYELAKADKAKSFTELSSANKSKVVSIVAEISSKTSVKASLTNDGVLTIFESDGKTVFTKITDKDIAKQTGVNYYVLAFAGFVSVFGVAYIAKKAFNA